MEKKIGIYKITSPSDKVYIGQSRDIIRRFDEYKRLDCKSQIKLYHSFKKYSVQNHIFEIIEECEFNQLNIKERYWQEFYDVLNRDTGLNLFLTKTDILPQITSEETKAKQSISQKGHKNNLGKTHSDEAKAKMAKAKRGGTLSKEHKEKISKSHAKKEYRIILNLETGIFYNGINDAAQSIEQNRYYLGRRLRGFLKNNTPFIYV